ncbi:Subtilisin-like protease SBT6.1, partial [Bienertia sinuspersici]
MTILYMNSIWSVQKKENQKPSKNKEKKTEQQEPIQETEKIEIPMLENPKKKRKTRIVNETRTGCKAMIRFKQDKPTSDFLRHHLKSERNITDETGQLIESMVDCGIKPMDAYNFLCNEAGAEEIVGHTKRDHLNY